MKILVFRVFVFVVSVPCWQRMECVCMPTNCVEIGVPERVTHTIFNLYIYYLSVRPCRYIFNYKNKHVSTFRCKFRQLALRRATQIPNIRISASAYKMFYSFKKVASARAPHTHTHTTACVFWLACFPAARLHRTLVRCNFSANPKHTQQKLILNKCQRTHARE